MYWQRTELSLANKSALFVLVVSNSNVWKTPALQVQKKRLKRFGLLERLLGGTTFYNQIYFGCKMYLNNKELPIIYLYWFIASMFDFIDLFRFSFCSSSSTVIMPDTFSCFRPADTTHLHTKPQDMTLFFEQLVRWENFTTSRKPRFLITVNYSCAPNTAAVWWCPCSLCAHKPVNVSQFVIHQKPPAMFSGHGIS